MGCTQSKIENEETVIRCKERKQHIKEAISARDAFAAAHSSYTTSLRNVGAALSDFAHAQFPFAFGGGAVSALSFDSLPSLPPPPLPDFTPPPLQRAATMPEFSIPKPELPRPDHIIEEEDDEEEVMDMDDQSQSLRHRRSRRRNAIKSEIPEKDIEKDDLPIPPPSPPQTPPLNDRAPPQPQPQPQPPEMSGMAWDYFFPEIDNVPGPNLAEVLDVNRIEKEEIERKAFEEKSKRVAEAEKKAEEVEERVRTVELPTQLPPPRAAKVTKTVRNVAAQAEGKRAGKSGGGITNLLQIFKELDDCCLKASNSAHEVSKMLEANRLHYHSNFADDRGRINHSEKVLRAITWSKSFQGLSNDDNRNIGLNSDDHETHATVLEKMLAWEKKLFHEVKVGEQIKLEYEKKVASMNKLKNNDANSVSLERTKAVVSHLHTRYIVDMQALDSTISEINRLRDEQLYGKLLALADGMAAMWETMHIHHESQSKIVQALKTLDISQTPKETSEHLHERTVQLWAVIQEWHSQFEKLMAQQKRYIEELHSWLKLNLIPIENNLKEKVSSPQRPPRILQLLSSWRDHLEKLPDGLARTAMSNFSAVVDTIRQHQLEEMKMRDKCEDARREFNRKTQQFEDWYNKEMQRRTPPDDMDPNRALDKGHIAERQSAVELSKKKFEEMIETYQRQCIQVRQKSCTSLKSRLPELFLSVSTLSLACSDMYRKLVSTPKPSNPN